MITFRELLGDNLISDVPIAHQHNMEELLKKVNIIRKAWGQSMIVTSGYRDVQEHIAIYISKGTPKDKIPMKSAHLYGMAVDISDPYLQLTKWLKHLKEGICALEKADLYCEDGNKNWVHFQSRQPLSGNRWFKP